MKGVCAELPDWLPARSLSQLENRVSEARPRIENLARKHARARKENQHKLQAFSQQLGPADFSVSAGTKAVETREGWTRLFGEGDRPLG